MSLSLSQKIQSIYPSLKIPSDWEGIRLRNIGDQRGDFIDAWEHSTLARPTEEQLNNVDGASFLINAQNAQAKLMREAAYAKEADPLFFKAQRNEVPLNVWTDKIEEIRTRYPYDA